MQTIKAIYDGINFFPKQPVPVKGSYKVEITFLEPIDEQKQIPTRPPFEYGCMTGKMLISDDFDAPLDDMKEYME